jgi:hypothetical protein
MASGTTMKNAMPPTLCMLLGFSDFAHAEPFLVGRVEEHLRVVLRVRSRGSVVYDDDSACPRMGRESPETLMMNARKLGLCVFVLAERMDDVAPKYSANVGHVLCAPGATPLSATSAVWFDIHSSAFTFT